MPSAKRNTRGANTPDWEAVAQAIRLRRDELRLTQEEMTKDVGETTIYKIENAKASSYKPFTLRRLEELLMWPPGAIDKIARGESIDDPIEARLERLEHQVAEIMPLVRALRDALGG